MKHGYHMGQTRVYSTTILSVEISNLRKHPNTSVGFSEVMLMFKCRHRSCGYVTLRYIQDRNHGYHMGQTRV